MTIGIAAFGPHAGAAVLAAWAAAEAAGSGAIGGFAVFTVLTDKSRLLSVECQRGGLVAIRRNGFPDEMAHAPVAAIITSGPDRPLPLSQFLVAGNSALITGHRLPNLMGADEMPVNNTALRLIEKGMSAKDAVMTVCRDNPSLDAALIAVTRDAIGMAETATVRKRDDRGQMLVLEQDRGLALLHNSIFPVTGFADHVARAGMKGFTQSP